MTLEIHPVFFSLLLLLSSGVSFPSGPRTESDFVLCQLSRWTCRLPRVSGQKKRGSFRTAESKRCFAPRSERHQAARHRLSWRDREQQQSGSETEESRPLVTEWMVPLLLLLPGLLWRATHTARTTRVDCLSPAHTRPDGRGRGTNHGGPRLSEGGWGGRGGSPCETDCKSIEINFKDAVF